MTAKLGRPHALICNEESSHRDQTQVFRQGTLSPSSPGESASLTPIVNNNNDS